MMDQNKEIVQTGSASLGGIHCLTIVGQIEGHQLLGDDAKTTKYEHVLPTLAAIEEADEIGGLLILLNTMDYSLTGSSVHGISQARVLKWVAISSSRGSS